MVERQRFGVIKNVDGEVVYEGEHTVEEPEEEVEQIMPHVKRCTHCKGPFNKGVEIVVTSSLYGYKGTFCSYTCRRAFDERKETK